MKGLLINFQAYKEFRIAEQAAYEAEVKAAAHEMFGDVDDAVQKFEALLNGTK